MQPNPISLEAARRTPRAHRIHGDVSEGLLLRERRAERDRPRPGTPRTRFVIAVRAARARLAPSA